MPRPLDDDSLAAIEAITKLPTLRPRMVRLINEDGITQHLNLGKIVRWHPSPDADDPTLVVHMTDGDRLRFPDPDGKVDDALCSAFYDVTPGDLT